MTDDTVCNTSDAELVAAALAKRLGSVSTKHEKYTGIPHALRHLTVVDPRCLGSTRCRKSGIHVANQARGSVTRYHAEAGPFRGRMIIGYVTDDLQTC